jgi:hypothetical protein
MRDAACARATANTATRPQAAKPKDAIRCDLNAIRCDLNAISSDLNAISSEGCDLKREMGMPITH